jgi:hypothetical protein
LTSAAEATASGANKRAETHGEAARKSGNKFLGEDVVDDRSARKYRSLQAASGSN